MAALVEETTRASASPEAIWTLLSEPQSWRYWWPGCKHAASSDRRPLRDGSSFELVIEQGPLTATRRATVEVAQANRALLWVERSFGVTRRHAIYLEPGATTTQIRVRSTFSGWGLLLFRLLGHQVRAAESIRACLKGLRKAAERS